jgi:large subunit ribosomal protein L4
MSSVDVKDRTGSVTGSVELPGEVFDVTANVPLMHQVVVAQLAAARQGTHKTKTRGEVRGGGRKPYKQKGTGRARQGSTRAPQFAGGGIVHGPVPRDYSQRTPKKMKAAALRGALSDRARSGKVHVLSALVEGETPSTKAAAAALQALGLGRHVLVVVEATDHLTWKSLRNLTQVHVIAPGQLNTYDVLVSDDVVFTESALRAFLAGSPKGRSAKAVARESEVPAEEPKPAKLAKPAKVPAPVATEEPTTEEPASEEPAPEVEGEPATDAGETRPAGEGVPTEELVEEVAEQTDRNLLVEPAVEETDGDVPAAGETAAEEGKST